MNEEKSEPGGSASAISKSIPLPPLDKNIGRTHAEIVTENVGGVSLEDLDASRVRQESRAAEEALKVQSKEVPVSKIHPEVQTSEKSTSDVVEGHGVTIWKPKK